LLERVYRALPVLYLVWALPLLLTICWLMPPWSNGDEPNHMLRTVELAHGELLGQRLGPHDAGGMADAGILDAAAPFEPLKFHPERKVTITMRSAGDQVRWRGSASLNSFGNTAPYPPFLYLPAVVAVRISQMLGIGVDRSLFLARAATALAAALVNAAALTLARRTRYAVAALAMLPMTCSLDASVGQDALIIALSLLAVGWIDRMIERGRPANRGELTGLALALMAVGMARPPYVTFALLPLLTASRLRWASAAAACAVVVAVGAWSALVAAVVLVSRADPCAQASLLLGDPLRFGAVLLNTLRSYIPGYTAQFVGELGWLDTALPPWYVALAFAALAAAFAAAVAGVARRPWLALLVAVGGALLIFVVQYLNWTQPGADLIDGVQGRYFIPLAATLVLAVPTFPPLAFPRLAFPRLAPFVRAVAPAGICALGVTTPFVIVQALVVRYYIGN
jgi:hypothetical protein